MFRVRWPRLLNLFRRRTSAVNHFSKRFQTNKDQNPENASIWSLMFGKYLLVTNTVGTGLLLGIGDAIAQYFEQFSEKKPFDYSRSRSMTITGLVIGPVQHGFYHVLDQIVSDNMRGAILQKLLADQLIMSPIYITMFFYISSLLEGQSIKECNAQLSEKFLFTWSLDCCFWPGLQYLNFRYFTAIYRVIFINLVNCAYIVLLSYIKHVGCSKNPAQQNQASEKALSKK